MTYDDLKRRVGVFFFFVGVIGLFLFSLYALAGNQFDLSALSMLPLPALSIFIGYVMIRRHRKQLPPRPETLFSKMMKQMRGKREPRKDEGGS